MRFPSRNHVLLSLPLCMLAGSLSAQTVLNATDLTSLRAHIATANGGTGDYTINIAAGTYTLTGTAGDANPANGDLDIVRATAGNIILSGAGTATTIIDANNVDRVFHINATNPNVTVTFQNMTIRNGRAVDNGSATTEARGGGIYVQSTTNVTLSGVTLTNNQANGVNGAAGAAGGSAAPAGGTGGNAASGLGGAIYVTAGTVQITGCTLSQNTARGGNGGNGGNGFGAQYTSSSSTTFLLAAAGAGGGGGTGGGGRGGAIYAVNGSISISTSTLSTNSALGGNGGSGGNGGNDTTQGTGANGGAGGISGAAQGGGAYLAGGALTVSQSTLSGGVTTGGQGGAGGNGGGGFDRGGNGAAGAAGGLGRGSALYVQAGNGSVTASTLSGNLATGGRGGNGGAGGGITASTGGNGANGGSGGGAGGGGCYVEAGTVSITNSTLSGNGVTAGNGGNGGNGGSGFVSSAVGGNGGNGGVSGASQGGGVFFATGTLTLNNDTIASGTATAGTGGTGGAPGTPGSGGTTGSAGTVTASQGGNLHTGATGTTSNSSIFAGGTATQGPDVNGNLTAGASLFQTTVNGTVTPGTGANVTGVNPNLQALANNGGTTLTRALVAGSPALDVGSNPGALTTDQRGTGFPRQSGSGVDIGAFELQTGPTPPAAPTVTDPATTISVNAANYNIQGTAPANTLVRIYSDLNNNGIVDGADAVVASQQLTGGGTNFSIATPLTQNASNDFIAKAFDTVVESSGTDVPTISEDSTPPAIPTITNPVAPISIAGANYSIQGTAEANALVKVYRDTNANGMLDSGEPMVASQQLTGGGTTWIIASPLIASTANEFVVTATDAVGNESNAANVATITENTIPPISPPTVTTPSGPVTVNAATFNISGTAQADSLVRIYSDANNDGLVNGADAVVGSQQLTGGGTAFSISVSLTQNSPNNFIATATDATPTESSPANVPTITDDNGFAGGGSGGGGGGGGGCSTENTTGPWMVAMGAIGALLLALRGFFTRRA